MKGWKVKRLKFNKIYPISSGTPVQRSALVFNRQKKSWTSENNNIPCSPEN
ncbi:MAG: hypothetical protein AVDCRST_MAG95-3471 [uncultured Adhaeribacter sp.]|uniref:Uncharacterized protein n=1 Tax=uncultured Adhaeribacter sp. TaxID=448109 RepID=A0A6J4JNX1_9BACT|nr:MAG: hypothetical protein AVDCRST_MAG95-3471 [uncultured Adhaeribacter sp.]